jgi:DNA-binding LytR/AlgR family response regulator
MQPIRNQPQNLHKLVSDFNEISHLSADINYTRIHLQNGEKHILSYTLKRFEEMLEGFPHFVRIHRGYLVNTNHIRSKSTSEVLMKDGLRLPVARRRSV